MHRGHSFAILLLCWWIPRNGAQSTNPSSLGCSYEPDRMAMRCRNTTLENIVHSVRILDAAANASIQTKSVEVTDSLVPHLPYIFPNFNTSLESVTLVGCQMEFVYPDAFAKLGGTLKKLNVSRNKLHSVPYALSVLKNLRILDLSDNQIVFLRPSPVFDGLMNLRVLILDGNYLGLSSRHVTDVRHPNITHPPTEGSLASSVGREDFDLGVSVRTLVKLSLKRNKLNSVPDEVFRTSLPSIRFIDLSHNSIQVLPEFSHRLLPKLEVLLLNSNRINSVAFYSLPVKLSLLDISGNPFRCDCEALWLSEWHHHSNNTLLFPVCQSPESNRGLGLSTIQRHRLCPQEKNSVSYVHKSTWKYRILATSSTSHSITVNWVVEREGFDFWGLVYRRASDSPYQMILSNDHRIIKHSSEGSKKEVVFSDHIENLSPATTYVACVAVTQKGKYLMEPARCHKITTEPSKEDANPKFTVVLTGLVPTEKTIKVEWRLSVENGTDLSVNPVVWKLSVRQFSTLNVTRMIVEARATDQDHQYVIENLLPGLGYSVCLESDWVSEGPEVISVPSYPIGTINHKKEPTLCKEVMTVAEERLPVTEIAVATTVSTTTTVFVAVVIFFCCPKSVFRCRAKNPKEKLFKEDLKSSVEETAESSNLDQGAKLPAEKRARPAENFQNRRYFGSTLESQKKKITPVGIPQVPPVGTPQLSSLGVARIPPTSAPQVPPAEDLSPPYEQEPYDPALPDTDESPNYIVPPDYEESAPSIERESNETNEDEGYLTPKTFRKCRKNRTSSFNNGEGYIHPKDIHYLGGRKVQVFIRGSRTLPRKVFLQPSSSEPYAFHPRYSLPHAWRRKDKESKSHSAEQTSNSSLWFKSSSSEDFPSLKTGRKDSRASNKSDFNNPYCIEHV